jgi:hypothetical protein
VCLVTVHSLQQWADTIHSTVRSRFTTNIMTVDEIYSGEDARGTGAEGFATACATERSQCFSPS